MSQYDFAIVADDIMINGAFLLRQTLSEWYSCALWFPRDLEGYARQLEGIPRVFFIGDSTYARFYEGMVGTQWEKHGVRWGAARRSAVIRATQLAGKAQQMELDMELAHMRHAVAAAGENATQAGPRLAAHFLDPYTAMRTMPPSVRDPAHHAQLIQHQIAITAFLQLGFDDWCWG